MPIDEKKILQSINDIIFDSLTGAPQGVGGGARQLKPDQSFLTLMNPGIAVWPPDFADAWSPTNTDGQVNKAENFARLCDESPALEPIYKETGKSVSSLYGQVVHADVITPPEDPAAKAEFEKAKDVLFDRGMIINSLGEEEEGDVESALFLNYMVKAEAYESAVTSFIEGFLGLDMTLPADQKRWALLGPRLRGPVDRAWKAWGAAHKGKVEAALATMNQYRASSVAKVFADAGANFELAKNGSSIPNMADWYTTLAYPANWFAPSATGYVQVTVDSNDLYTSSSSSHSSWSASGGLNLGLFSVGGGGGGSRSYQRMSSETKNFSLSFEFMRVTIRRPWLDASLFEIGNWYLEGRPRSWLSNGKGDPTNNGAFPLMPVGLIVARNVSVTATWGQSDFELITSASGGGGGFSLGPFSFGGRTSSSSTSQRFQSSWDKKTVKAPGIQIVGFINRVVPLSPPNNQP